MTDAIRPFTIDVPAAVLDDLRQRLQRTRWPDAAPAEGWQQGVPLDWLRTLCAHWAEGYDWPARQALLNRHPQFVTTIDGLDIHFIHIRSPHPGALPLLLTHGWPGSVVEFQRVIGPLSDPPAHGGSAADAFDLVIPSLPGFGFSGKPRTTGWGVDRIAATWATLMARLGYSRYVAQGGDWGSAVTSALGAADPGHCAGIHVTLAMGAGPKPGGEPGSDELFALKRIQFYREWDTGYATQQATRPQTVGYALNDSPAGQAAWMLEKFYAWTDCDGDPLNIIDRDALLDNLMLYWVTASATSSARIYWESFGPGKRALRPVTVPTGVAVYPKEIVPPVRRWMESAGFANIRHWQAMPRGGHFAAMEQPALFVDDLRAFFQTLR
jgi:pimeloyl-ACP methyl ester carboxylesterase